MLKLKPILVIFIFSLLFYNCKEKSAKKEKTKSVIEKTDSVTKQPAADEIIEFGIIKKIEDAPYPIFVVTVEFPERKMEADFNVNIESISLNLTDLNNLLGKYATLHYTPISENMLMDIYYNGASIHKENAPEIDNTYKKITGVLSGATQETAGDLPSTIYITKPDNTKIEFKEFVTPKIVALNNKTVTIYYYTRYKNVITFLKKAEE